MSAAPVTRSTFLPCPPDRAFMLFTERASDWWPEGLRHTPDPRSAIRLLATGRFFERASGGVEVELGRVLVWEPGRLLAFDFYPGTDGSHPTAVVVRFDPVAGGTRVSVEHRPKPESAALWQEGAPRFARSWEQVLAALSRAASSASW